MVRIKWMNYDVVRELNNISNYLWMRTCLGRHSSFVAARLQTGVRSNGKNDPDYCTTRRHQKAIRNNHSSSSQPIPTLVHPSYSPSELGQLVSTGDAHRFSFARPSSCSSSSRRRNHERHVLAFAAGSSIWQHFLATREV